MMKVSSRTLGKRQLEMLQLAAMLTLSGRYEYAKAARLLARMYEEGREEAKAEEGKRRQPSSSPI